MLSRTSLAASRASCRSATRTLVRANSTTSGSAEGATSPAADSATPKRSIPRAAAFADLLAQAKAPKQASRAPGVGLASLADDQFDGLIKRSSPLWNGQQKDRSQYNGQQRDGQQRDGQQRDGQQRDGQQRNGQQRNGQQRDGQQRDGQQKDGQQRSTREKFTLENRPQQMTVDGVAVQIPQRARPPRNNVRQPYENRNQIRNNDRQPRQDQRNQPREARPAQAAQQKREGQRGRDSAAAQRPKTPERQEVPVQENSQAAPQSETSLFSPAPIPSPSAKPSQPRARPAAKRVDSAALAKLFDITLTGPTELVRRPSTQFTLIGTPTILESQAGDYSRYLDKSLVNQYSQSPKLGPVDYARLTLAKRPDVTLEERSKAVGIMSAAVEGARATVRA